jgi:hypothetical protein
LNVPEKALSENDWQTTGDVRLRGREKRFSAGGCDRSATTQRRAIEHRGIKFESVRDMYMPIAIQIAFVATTSTRATFCGNGWGVASKQKALTLPAQTRAA